MEFSHFSYGFWFCHPIFSVAPSDHPPPWKISVLVLLFSTSGSTNGTKCRSRQRVLGFIRSSTLFCCRINFKVKAGLMKLNDRILSSLCRKRKKKNLWMWFPVLQLLHLSETVCVVIAVITKSALISCRLFTSLYPIEVNGKPWLWFGLYFLNLPIGLHKGKGYELAYSQTTGHSPVKGNLVNNMKKMLTWM